MRLALGRGRATLWLAGLALVVCGAALTSACRTTGFSSRLPAGLPDTAGWERSSGAVELDAPRRSVTYELFVQPQRPAVYSICRYRIVLRTPAAAANPADAWEKLQWDRDGKDVRRYVCEPQAQAPCRWRELARGSAEYDIEMPAIISIYTLHAQLLREREAGRLR